MVELALLLSRPLEGDVYYVTQERRPCDGAQWQRRIASFDRSIVAKAVRGARPEHLVVVDA